MNCMIHTLRPTPHGGIVVLENELYSEYNKADHTLHGGTVVVLENELYQKRNKADNLKVIFTFEDVYSVVIYNEFSVVMSLQKEYFDK